MEIKKDDLAFNHYTWYDQGAENRQDITPTRNAFDRNNGTHILWVVNWYAAQYATFQKEDISSLEILLSEKLPSGLLSERSVSQWLTSVLSK